MKRKKENLTYARMFVPKTGEYISRYGERLTKPDINIAFEQATRDTEAAKKYLDEMDYFILNYIVTVHENPYNIDKLKELPMVKASVKTIKYKKQEIKMNLKLDPENEDKKKQLVYCDRLIRILNKRMRRELKKENTESS